MKRSLCSSGGHTCPAARGGKAPGEARKWMDVGLPNPDLSGVRAHYEEVECMVPRAGRNQLPQGRVCSD